MLDALCRVQQKKGSSPNSGERGADLQEEVGVIAEAIGHPLDDLLFVVDALDQVGAEGPAAVGEDARQVGPWPASAPQPLQQCRWLRIASGRITQTD